MDNQDNENENEKNQLTAGPLPKSIYTCQLEDITRQLLMGKDFEVRWKNGDAFISIENTKYNWTQIIKHANLDHIELNRHDFYLYSQFVKTTTMKPTLLPENEMSYRRALYREYDLNNKPLPDPVISFQEMQAINTYTNNTYETYRDMNDLLRNKFHFFNNIKTKEIIIQSVFCASGLRKIPETLIKEVYRGANVATEKLNDYIKAAAEQKIIHLSGFVSASTIDIDSLNDFKGKPARFQFTQLKGVYIAPISQHPSEKEFLIPPTQVQLTHYQDINGKPCFEGRLVADLASVDTQSLEMSQTPTASWTAKPDLSTIVSLETLREQLQYCSPIQCASVFETYKQFITSAAELSSVLEFLPTESRKAVFDVMLKDNQLINMIQSANDVACVLKYLPPEQCSIVFEIIKYQLPALIKSADDFQMIQVCLSPEQTFFLLNLMQDKWTDIIKSKCSYDECGRRLPSDLSKVIQYLTPEQCTVVLNAIISTMKGTLGKLITDCYDLFDILTNLEPTQRASVLSAINHQAPDIILSIPMKPSPTTADLWRCYTYEQRNLYRNILSLEEDLSNTSLKTNAKAFASAFLSENNARIKAEFEHLIENAKKPDDIILVFSKKPQWMEKTAAALGITQSDLKEGMNQYISQYREDKKTITQHYKQVIQSLSTDSPVKDKQGPKYP